MRQESIRAALGAEHVRVEEGMRRLANAAEGADRVAMRAEWGSFERALRDHLELEERELFVPVEAIEPTAVEQARVDHRRIREMLDELGMQVDLHTVRKETIDGFIELLRAHAAREDAALYRHADAALSSTAARSVTSHAR